MHEFKGFLIKEFYHIFRDRRTMLILFAMPVLQMLLFGYVITNEINHAQIAVLDKSDDYITRKIITRLSASGYFEIKSYLQTHDEIKEAFQSGEVREVVVFEDNFSESLNRFGTANVHIITDASDANTANLIANYTSALIARFSADEFNKDSRGLTIKSDVRMMYNPEMKSVFMFVPGTMAMILILISALLTSVTIVREKETSSMEVLLVSPLKPAHIIVGKVAPYAVLSLINAFTIILLGHTVFGLPVLGSFILLFSECLLFILMALSLGVLISTTTNSQQVAMMLAMVALLMPAILLSGFIFPIENMPFWLQWICKINPSTYFIIIIKNIMLKGSGFMAVWRETLILAFYTFFFLFVSIRKFKTRLT
ncbi:MAG: ABC transporter permease [Bacteroidales bacterium]|nr:ABC transporter permease [Bacteroidales bacterium]